MSRIGRKPILVPKDVKVQITESVVEVQGPKGKLSTPLAPGIHFVREEEYLKAQRSQDTRQQAALHGLMRKLVANSIEGVTKGFSKELEIVGIGYKADSKGKTVLFNLGYSHPIDFPLPVGISIAVEKQTRLTVSGCDKQLVGQVAADIRGLRPPDPYKNKGIRYVGERLKKKVGKTGVK
ncbi:MAG: 50S ribosomal protein L6 [Acidobacteriia bacterium]|nr:50S ribosomal protein L6 [Terriglobia bacterium]